MIAQWVLPVLLAQSAVLLANLWHWRRRRLNPIDSQPQTPLRLSVLIPVRNERERLPQLVQSLRSQRFCPHEIILCDDSSDDGTREWLEANLPRHGGDTPISWFPAPPKPPGWVGKNWACHQLAQRAEGDWWLFLDADLHLHHAAIGSMAHHIARFAGDGSHSVVLVTAIPTLEPSSTPVGLLKAMVPFSVFTLLPLHFAEGHPHRSFAFANGQVMAFSAPYYRQAQLHERVRQAVLEDVQVARVVKADGGLVRIADGRMLFRVSMYRNLREAVDGFSKNGVAICGSVAGAMAVSLALTVVYLLPILEALAGRLTTWHLMDFGLSAVLFALSGWMAGLPLWYGALYPLSVAIGEWTLWRSVVWYTRGEVRWKGRTYPVP